MKRTISEAAFERFCDGHGIAWSRIATADALGEQRPDYALVIGGHSVIAEVKQFDPTDEEERLYQELEETGRTSVAFGGEPGDRARKKIAKGAAQLRSLSDGTVATLLVLFHNVPLTHRHTDSYSIKTAMYGLEAITLAVPTDSDPYVSDQGFARRGKRKVSRTDNTSLSAVGVLEEQTPDKHYLLIYHNLYARVPLEPDWLRIAGVHHFKLGVKKAGDFQEWVDT